ncbi:MAG: hypothetical protein CMJ95_10710 [Planctomycetes bacterium]|nr:hypothetical protein [Planctomycetota bacterium]
MRISLKTKYPRNDSNAEVEDIKLHLKGLQRALVRLFHANEDLGKLVVNGLETHTTQSIFGTQIDAENQWRTRNGLLSHGESTDVESE